MNRLLVILMISASLASHAEYGGWFIQFQLETVDGEQIHGHTYVAQAYFDMDSVSFSAYLIERFDVLDHEERGTIIFYHDLLKYKYRLPESRDEYVEYGLLGRDSILNSKVTKITVTDTIYHWYLSGISTDHVIADTTWLQTDPKDVIMVDGYYCAWNVFIHENEALATEILNEVKQIEESYIEQFNAVESKYSGQVEYEASRAYEELEVDMENEISEYLHSIKGKKILIITFCSC